jgi:hypothetical protein
VWPRNPRRARARRSLQRQSTGSRRQRTSSSRIVEPNCARSFSWVGLSEGVSGESSGEETCLARQQDWRPKASRRADHNLTLNPARLSEEARTSRQ